MDKKIRIMIDEIFSEMKMTAENLALRDEMMANALERYEDNLAQGRSEEQAFGEVAASLGDVQAMLEEMNAMSANAAGQAQPEQEAKKEEAGQEEPDQAETTEAAQQADGSAMPDIGEALSRAFSALGGFGQAIMPEAKKLVGQMDDVSGGMLSKLGRATKKGLRGAQKAAGEAIDRLSGDGRELVFDFGPKTKREEAPQEESCTGAEMPQEEPSAQEPLDTDTGIPLDEEEAQDTEQNPEICPEACPQEERETPAAPLYDENGEIDEASFERAVEDMAREAEEAVREAEQAAGAAPVQDEAKDTVCGEQQAVSGCKRFSVAGLQAVDIQLDADDVEILPAQDETVEAAYTAYSAECEPVIEMQGHTLVIRRRNPDVFKTFFSVFAKEGGRITLRMPKGCAAKYRISATSGDVQMTGVDADEVKVNTTSGRVKVETESEWRAKLVSVTTVSGHAQVSASAREIAVTTVSGNQRIACRADKMSVSAVSGKVYAEGVCNEWEINAVHSDAELLCTAAPERRIQVSAMQGTVHLALPGDIRGFTAEMTGALGGKIVNEFGPNRYGNCELPIRMDTLHGTLIITRL